MKSAILFISHGSRSEKTIQEIKNLLLKLREKIDIPIVEFAFLEIEKPSIAEGIDICIDKGADNILILLNFLNAGRHVDTDIPEIIHTSQKKHPHVSIKMSQPIGQHPQIVDLFADLIKKW